MWLGEGSVNGGFAASLLGALLLERSKTNSPKGTHVLYPWRLTAVLSAKVNFNQQRAKTP
jgi:hypothetical protein